MPFSGNILALGHLNNGLMLSINTNISEDWSMSQYEFVRSYLSPNPFFIFFKLLKTFNI